MHSVPVPIIVRSGRAWRTLKTTLMTQLYRWRRDFGAAQQADIHLFDTEFFGVPVEHKALTCKETDFQPGTHPIVVLSRDAVNESIAFQYCRPYGREIISLAHQLGTQLRQVVCSLFCHQTMPVQGFTLSIDLNQSVGRNENGLRRNRRRVDSEARGRMHGMNNKTDASSKMPFWILRIKFQALNMKTNVHSDISIAQNNRQQFLSLL